MLDEHRRRADELGDRRRGEHVERRLLDDGVTSRPQAEPSPTRLADARPRVRSVTIAVSPMPAAASASRWWNSTGLFATGARCRVESPRLGPRRRAPAVALPARRPSRSHGDPTAGRTSYIRRGGGKTAGSARARSSARAGRVACGVAMSEPSRRPLALPLPRVDAPRADRRIAVGLQDDVERDVVVSLLARRRPAGQRGRASRSGGIDELVVGPARSARARRRPGAAGVMAALRRIRQRAPATRIVVVAARRRSRPARPGRR